MISDFWMAHLPIACLRKRCLGHHSLCGPGGFRPSCQAELTNVQLARSEMDKKSSKERPHSPAEEDSGGCLGAFGGKAWKTRLEKMKTHPAN